MDVGHHEHLAVRLERAPLRQQRESTGVVDPEGSAGPLHHHEVGMGAAEGPSARRALAASPRRAEQGGPERLRGGAGPGAVGAEEQVGVHRVAGRRPQGRRPRESCPTTPAKSSGTGGRSAAVTVRATRVATPRPRPPRAATSSAPRSPSTTAQWPGSRPASSL